MALTPHEDVLFARAVEALAALAKNVGAVAGNIGRLAAAVENANEVAVKHNQWVRREDSDGAL